MRGPCPHKLPQRTRGVFGKIPESVPLLFPPGGRAALAGAPEKGMPAS
jgi:hypothetical protein